MLNKTIFTGRIPDHENFPFEVKNAENVEKAVIRFALSVQRNFKGKEDKYYPEDIIPFVAFGHNAQFIGNYFKKGDYITVEGNLQREKDWEDPQTGEKHRGQLVNIIGSAYFPGVQSSSSENSTASSASVVKAKAAKTATTKKSGLVASLNLPKKKSASTLKAPVLGGGKKAFIS